MEEEYGDLEKTKKMVGLCVMEMNETLSILSLSLIWRNTITYEIRKSTKVISHLLNEFTRRDLGVRKITMLQKDSLNN